MSFAMCLDLSFARRDDALLLEAAVNEAIESGARTVDMASSDEPVLSTAQMGDAVLTALDAKLG